MIYFSGPPEDMFGLAPAGSRCSLCGKTERCWELDFLICEELSDDEQDGELGCEDCLRAGRFLFPHNTEIGTLTEEGLIEEYSSHSAPPPDFPVEALVELLRTPIYSTWQEEVWLTHCNDFMTFVGTWAPADFEREAEDGDGRSLFLAMTEPELNFLWDDGISDEGHWCATYYAFQCRQCETRRGHWDSP